jgi:uridine monophosphate synthetase
MRSFFSKLEARIQKIDSLLCVGLDPHPSDLRNLSYVSVKDFCTRIISETSEFAVAYKPNIAFFEALGHSGIRGLREIIRTVPDDIPVILDAKRGDIASTANAYAKAVFDELGADALTANPYLGKDSIDPFITDSRKGVFLLCKTSNPGASDFQDVFLLPESKNVYHREPLKLFEYVAKLAQMWNVGDNLGLVVGATQPESLEAVRNIAPKLWILAPGVGAQGGDLREALKAGLRTDGLGMIIPVSRGISRSDNPRQAALKLRNSINSQRTNIHISLPKSSENLISPLQSKIADDLLDAGCIKFGEFTLKSGVNSPIYIDLRRLVGYPKILSNIGTAYSLILERLNFGLLAALPYAAMPITTTISLLMNRPMVYPRKEVKDYGTKVQVEGVFEVGEKTVVIDDLISTGSSKFEGIQKLEKVGLVVEDVVVLIDRSPDGGVELVNKGYKLHAVLTINQLLSYYEKTDKVDQKFLKQARKFVSQK